MSVVFMFIGYIFGVFLSIVLTEMRHEHVGPIQAIQNLWEYATWKS